MSWTGWDDERGVSEVLGAIMLFGILILAIGLLQSFYVPQQLSMTEQNHVDQVTDDFTEMYSAIGDATGSNKERTSSISLGTRYGINSIFLTPPPVSGTVKSENQGVMSSSNGEEVFDIDKSLVEDVCGLDDVETKSITYKARYNEYRDAPSHVYEAGVHYRAVNDQVAFSGNQRLIDRGGSVTTVHLTPITHGSIRESGTTKESLTFKPGVTGETSTFSGSTSNPVEITIPINSRAGWDATFEDGLVTPSDTEATMTFDDTSETYRIRCTPIGIDTDPENSPSAEFRGDDDSDDSGSVNPIGSGALVLQGSSTATQLDFENTAAAEKTVTEVRIPWVMNPGNVGDEFDLNFDGTGAETVPVASNSWTDIGDWTWPSEDDSESEKSIVVDTNSGGGNPNSGYAIVFKFDDGTTATYLVSG